MVEMSELQAGLKKQAQQNTKELNPYLAQYNNEEISRMAAKVIGVLAEAPSQDMRRRVLAKARRMLSIR